MARCKGCVYFETQEDRAVCLAQDTYSAEMKDPDLGEKLRGCQYEPAKKTKKKKEEAEDELQA